MVYACIYKANLASVISLEHCHGSLLIIALGLAVTYSNNSRTIDSSEENIQI